MYHYALKNRYFVIAIALTTISILIPPVFAQISEMKLIEEEIFLLTDYFHVQWLNQYIDAIEKDIEIIVSVISLTQTFAMFIMIYVFIKNSAKNRKFIRGLKKD